MSHDRIHLVGAGSPGPHVPTRFGVPLGRGTRPLRRPARSNTFRRTSGTGNPSPTQGMSHDRIHLVGAGSPGPHVPTRFGVPPGRGTRPLRRPARSNTLRRTSGTGNPSPTQARTFQHVPPYLRDGEPVPYAGPHVPTRFGVPPGRGTRPLRRPARSNTLRRTSGTGNPSPTQARTFQHAPAYLRDGESVPYAGPHVPTRFGVPPGRGRGSTDTA